jgi:hypothetical protein
VNRDLFSIDNTSGSFVVFFRPGKQACCIGRGRSIIASLLINVLLSISHHKQKISMLRGSVSSSEAMTFISAQNINDSRLFVMMYVSERKFQIFYVYVGISLLFY